MKQKKLFILAAAAALLAACSSDDEITAEKQAAQQAAQQEVGFSAYVNRGTTRAGKGVELVTSGSTGSQITLLSKGFGVFAYYTDNQPYSETSIPNFMYNEKVTGTGSSAPFTWEYSPIKYWPNEFGSKAISEGQDRLTFFAYAPWVEVTPETGIATETSATGIIALTRNTATGDPYVKYYGDFNPTKSVDLCYGVANAAFNSSVDGTNNNIEVGKPYIDVIKPKTGVKITFDFKQALAALNVTIDADVDVVSHADGNVNDLTKIWVRSVTFTGFTDKGMLNLNSEASADPYYPNWYDLSGNNKIGSGSVTIYDGRRDGKEGQTGATMSNETPNALNPVLIQNEPYKTASLPTKLELSTSTTVGVQHTPVNLFASSTVTDPIFVIPTDDNLEVTIVYDIETADSKLSTYLSDGATKGSTIENKITKTIQLSSEDFKLQAGKKYTIALHLGLTSVKFDASVTAWEDKTADKTDLPINSTTP